MPAVVVLLAFGYLCGSIPFGLLLTRRTGIDVRRAGSGNVGAANVARTAGAGLGVLTLIADAGKGALPVLVTGTVMQAPALAAAVGFAAFLGHLYPITLGFAGGKGVATALGVLLVIAPDAALAGLVVFTVAFALTRRVSVGSMTGAASAAVAVALTGRPGVAVASAAVMALVVLVRHRENIARLRAGTEPRLDLHKNRA